AAHRTPLSIPTRRSSDLRCLQDPRLPGPSRGEVAVVLRVIRGSADAAFVARLLGRFSSIVCHTRTPPLRRRPLGPRHARRCRVWAVRAPPVKARLAGALAHRGPRHVLQRTRPKREARLPSRASYGAHARSATAHGGLHEETRLPARPR